MKWCFIVNDAPFLMEFFGRLAHQIVKEGDACLVILTSKISEYTKKQYFPKNAEFISKVDWSIKNFDPEKKEFGELSWRDFYPSFDRVKHPKLDYKEAIDKVLQEYQFFKFVFETEKPDVALSEPPVGIINEVVYYFSKKHGIPFFGFLESRFDERIDVYDLEWTDSRYEPTFEKLRERDVLQGERAFVQEYFDKFLSHKESPSFMKHQKIYFSNLGLIWHYVERIHEIGGVLLRYFRNRRRFRRYDYESEAVFLQRIRTFFAIGKRQFRIFSQKGFFDFLNDDDNFFVFPLHLQPEATTSVLAMYYVDQLNTIRNIAFTLPFPYKLYVKEHPSAVGMQKDSFYAKLKKIPNVVLIAPGENVEQLIKQSSGVIVLTSTVGMEAALAGKPVYVLGNVFYTYHPLCRKVKNFDELRKAIQTDMDRRPDTSNLDSINLRFITSYLRNTLSGSIFSAASDSDINDYPRLYKELGNMIKEYAVSKTT